MERNVLVCNSGHPIQDNFYGKVIQDIDDLPTTPFCNLYLAGNIETMLSESKLDSASLDQMGCKEIFVIQELASEYDFLPVTVIKLGNVPVNVHGVGVLIPEFFDSSKDYFAAFESEHKVQDLTESNKDGVAYRKGVYLTKVQSTNTPDEYNFNLLRCSSNLQGPTENFQTNDLDILAKLNATAADLYPPVELNHVLAQIYYNHNVDGKDRKARIAHHSDKTKDMPKNALLAFCSFYEGYTNGAFQNKKYRKHGSDPYNFYHKNSSVLTTLRFKLKDCISDPKYKKEFDVVLYPNSVFFIDLTTNRLYTHAIVPPHVESSMMPTRLGYVVRCSSTPAVYKNGKTHILKGDTYEELQQPSVEDVLLLKAKYAKENITADIVDYLHVNFSLNQGDYICPKL